MPDAIDGSHYNYFLVYTKDTDPGTKLVQAITFQASQNDNSTGTFVQNFPVASYNMFLYAVPQSNTTVTAATTDADTISGAAVLSAYTSIDLRYVNEISFYLTDHEVPGNGTFNIFFKNAADFSVPTGYTVKVGIYGADDDALKFPASDAQSVTVTSGAFTGTIGSASDTLASGNYNLKVTFTNASNKKYIYSERLIIMANRSTTRDSTNPVIVPDVIEKLPTKPGDFIAGYTEPSTSKNLYTVEFAWTDTSYREDGFEIDLMRLDDASTAKYPSMPTTDAEWSTLQTSTDYASGTVYDKTYYGSHSVNDGVTAWSSNFNTVRVLELNKQNITAFRDSQQDGGTTNATGGSLNMNSSHIKLSLPLEHRFVARIRSVNQAGESDWTYLTLPHSTPLLTAGSTANTNNAEVTTAQYTLAATKAFDTDVETVNLYRLTYDVGQNYTFSSVDATSGAATVLSSNPSLIQYKSQHSSSGAASTTSVAILSPNSKANDTTVTPNVVCVHGTKNKIATTGLATDDIELQLKQGSNFWRGWKIDKTTGQLYTQTQKGTAPSQYDEPAIWTQYKNLTLFADYSATANLNGTVIVEDINNYEMKPAFVTVTTTLNSTAATPTTCTLVDASGKLDASVLGAKNVLRMAEVDKIAFTLDASAATYQTVPASGGTAQTVNINYEKFSLVVQKANGGETVCNESTQDFTVSLDLPLTGLEKGIYNFKISGHKGNKTFELTPNLVLDIVN